MVLTLCCWIWSRTNDRAGNNTWYWKGKVQTNLLHPKMQLCGSGSCTKHKVPLPLQDLMTHKPPSGWDPAEPPIQDLATAHGRYREPGPDPCRKPAGTSHASLLSALQSSEMSASVHQRYHCAVDGLPSRFKFLQQSSREQNPRSMHDFTSKHRQGRRGCVCLVVTGKAARGKSQGGASWQHSPEIAFSTKAPFSFIVGRHYFLFSLLLSCRGRSTHKCLDFLLLFLHLVK